VESVTAIRSPKKDFFGDSVPRIPGHEVAGIIDAIGPGVPPRWKPGQRVGVGWHGWHCGYCDACRRGDFFACQTGAQITASRMTVAMPINMIASAPGLALIPEDCPRRSGTADVRRAHDIQRSTQQRRPAW